MAANPTIYCLENISDYFEFERLCHSIMALEGYPDIEPLGGFADRGRDAVHVSASGTRSIFAYSVREDWRAKLSEDASKILKHGHQCDNIVFVTTARFTASERDEAVSAIRAQFGWQLDLLGLERLRILLDVVHPVVKPQHPQIFPPGFLQSLPPAGSGSSYVLLSYALQDRVFAEWLARKLATTGYLVWAETCAFPETEPYPLDIDGAIRTRVAALVALYSSASLGNPEVMRQRAVALSFQSERGSGILIPIDVDGVSPQQLDRPTSQLRFLPALGDWSQCLSQLLRELEARQCPRPLPRGAATVLGLGAEARLLSDAPEPLFTNILSIQALPTHIYRFTLPSEVAPGKARESSTWWPFRQVNETTLLSFFCPPSTLATEIGARKSEEIQWHGTERIEGIDTNNLVSELIRKSLIAKTHEKGLLFCNVTGLHYFPIGLPEGDRIHFIKPDGSRSYVNSTGRRTYWHPSGSEQYAYSLAPSFSVTSDLFDPYSVLVRVRVRLTDLSGEPLPTRKAVSRRKHLCRNWWNDDWLHRVLAVCQFLADGDAIVVGDSQDQQMAVHSAPLIVESPISINEEALDAMAFERDSHEDAMGPDHETDDLGSEEVPNA